jgi:hypothetical protein
LHCDKTGSLSPLSRHAPLFPLDIFGFQIAKMIAFEKDVKESLQDFHERLLKLPGSFRYFTARSVRAIENFCPDPGRNSLGEMVEWILGFPCCRVSASWGKRYEVIQKSIVVSMHAKNGPADSGCTIPVPVSCRDSTG